MKTITISNQIRIAYKTITGDPRKPLLLFLHEGLGCIRMWRNFPQALCEHTGCAGIVYDRQGYGASSPLDAKRTVHYLHEYAHCELPRVMEVLVPDQPLVIVGHSDGGSIGLLRAADRTPQIKGVITTAAHVFVDELTLSGIASAVTAYESGKMKALKRYHGQKTKALFYAWADTWLANWFQSWNITYALASIVCPVLVIQGRQDQYGTSEQVTTIVKGIGPHAQAVMVDNCGHSPHLDQPELILQHIHTFLLGIAGNL